MFYKVLVVVLERLSSTITFKTCRDIAKIYREASVKRCVYRCSLFEFTIKLLYCPDVNSGHFDLVITELDILNKLQLVLY